MRVFKKVSDKFLNKDKAPLENLEKNRVKTAIENTCAEYLLDYDDVLTFEATPTSIAYVIELIENDLLSNRYEYVQYTETLFKARLKEVLV